ncbi:formamidopyrimidine-DNA glycosylase [Propionibacterium cyclohexanicum]|uniref:Formamidopyrimidine-DNA glycosylase n=1 Tax=Propionibacterium cyclohexanicum TaxID=64702 RepID=A0A1H9PR80_9ACTN|nr:bifunctional DNA-formamidopyrimidine glycosylase/DNA-(apurinic or apyrimidinic site) lyase [Propionibacterium cyclohexanicum]SER50325.1 formamidopyrimidine-DNA glycosylase [Propionibacterium cyclohexanicum]
MPELPEVETVRAGLEPLVVGRTVSAVHVLDARCLRRHSAGAADFCQRLRGQRLADVRRRGKYLWIPTVAGDVVLAHLGMSGQFRLDSPGDILEAHARLLIDLDDGSQLRFVDQRLFGGLALSKGPVALPAEIAHIGADPFEPGFDLAAVADRMIARHSTVKRCLLDQTLVSGIGNIYADEALWLSRTHYEHPSQTLSTRRARRVLRAARTVMAAALAQGGTSFDALYVNVNGSSGYFSRHLEVYGRAGRPCRRCGSTIVRESFMNRSSYLCPVCQPLPAAHVPAPAQSGPKR